MNIAKADKNLIDNYEELRMDAFFCENKERLASEITRLVESGYDRFIVGLAELLDVVSIEALQGCQERYPNVEYVVVVYDELLTKRFSPNVRRRANEVADKAAMVVMTSREFHSIAFNSPHPYLTETLQLSVAYSPIRCDGGTLYTYKFNEKGVLPLVDIFNHLDPDSPFRE